MKRSMVKVYAAVFIGYFVFALPHIAETLTRSRGYIAFGGEYLAPFVLVLAIEFVREGIEIVKDFMKE